MTTRKFLDRSRSLRLDGQPLQVDWELLLRVGVTAVERGYATDPWLESTMWTTIAPRGRFRRPLLFDFPLLRRWLDVEPANAVAYMREGFGPSEAPRNVEEALGMLASSDCYSAGLGSHHTIQVQDVDLVPTGEWFVGTCHDCFRALLWFSGADGQTRQWPFYNQTIEMSAH